LADQGYLRQVVIAADRFQRTNARDPHSNHDTFCGVHQMPIFRQNGLIDILFQQKKAPTGDSGPHIHHTSGSAHHKLAYLTTQIAGHRY